jgi:hypothetical protein
LTTASAAIPWLRARSASGARPISRASGEKPCMPSTWMTPGARSRISGTAFASTLPLTTDFT